MPDKNIDFYCVFEKESERDKGGTIIIITMVRLGDRGDWKSGIPALQWISFRDGKKGYPNVNVVKKTKNIDFP